jgi:hypothetical protein
MSSLPGLTRQSMGRRRFVLLPQVGMDRRVKPGGDEEEAQIEPSPREDACSSPLAGLRRAEAATAAQAGEVGVRSTPGEGMRAAQGFSGPHLIALKRDLSSPERSRGSAFLSSPAQRG